MNDSALYRTVCSGIVINCHVCPRAKQEGVFYTKGTLTIKVSPPPVDHKATKRAIVLLAKKLEIPQTRFSVVKGHHSRNKSILIHTDETAHIIERLFPHG